MQTDTPDRILRLGAVLNRTGLTRSTLYRKMQTGTFPKQVRIATRCATASMTTRTIKATAVGP